MRLSCMCSHPMMLQPLCGYGHGYFIDLSTRSGLTFLQHPENIGTCWPQKHIPFMIFHYIPTFFPTVYSNDMSHPDKWSPQPPTTLLSWWYAGGWPILVGGFNPSEKYYIVSWDDEIPNIWENNKCSKPPTRIFHQTSMISTKWFSQASFDVVR